VPHRIAAAPVRSPSLPDNGRDPCAVCGEDTSVGTVFFSDRQTIELEDGSFTFACVLCFGRAR
jgi:hypothetical protein